MAVKKTKNRDASKRDLSEHVVAETTITEVQADTGDISGLSLASDLQWKVTQGEVHSDTKLEEDVGVGRKIVIRSFDFKANPEAFRLHTPEKQELFNAHARQIEEFLWRDGLLRVEEVSPKLLISKDKTGYRIIVGATNRLGAYFDDKAQTLTDIAHGRR